MNSQAKLAIVVFWLLVVLSWIFSYNHGLGYIIQGLGKILAVAHLIEMVIFRDTVFADSTKRLENSILVFVFGWLQINDLMSNKA